MKNILISADGGLRWLDRDIPYGSRYVVDALVMDKAMDLLGVKDIPVDRAVRVVRRTYQRVGHGDGFEVYREVLN